MKYYVAVEILGSYFVDYFYNQLYHAARSTYMCGKNEHSLTEIYKANSALFAKSIRKPELFSKVVVNINDYWCKSSGHSLSTIRALQDGILVHFIPQDMWSSFKDKDKDAALYELIVNTVDGFLNKIINNEVMRMIIDDHGNKNNVAVLQDMIHDVIDEYKNRVLLRYTVSKEDNGQLKKFSMAVADKDKKIKKLEEELKICKLLIKSLSKKITKLEQPITTRALSYSEPEPPRRKPEEPIRTQNRYEEPVRNHNRYEEPVKTHNMYENMYNRREETIKTAEEPVKTYNTYENTYSRPEEPVKAYEEPVKTVEEPIKAYEEPVNEYEEPVSTFRPSEDVFNNSDDAANTSEDDGPDIKNTVIDYSKEVNWDTIFTDN